MLIDTSRCATRDQRMGGNGSFGNEGEARLVAIHIDQLFRCGLQASSIAIKAPYNKEINLDEKFLLDLIMVARSFMGERTWVFNIGTQRADTVGTLEDTEGKRCARVENDDVKTEGIQEEGVRDR
ncbi:hypothetical protein TNIN_60971 [Trichonephila inaurata madagascariensis]|uniref:Uncharacterized protein n=1 Tax=Trichonephila inaurata madagascariensis TaxID=2747483 RepID=A0A8X7CJC7_9ARAC|nr:hypothetical protein TNIN_60971 [Trichonephila inaurata madagascariensis]